MPSLSAIMPRGKPVRAKMRLCDNIFKNVIQPLYARSLVEMPLHNTNTGAYRKLLDYLPYQSGYSFVFDNLACINNTRQRSLSVFGYDAGLYSTPPFMGYTQPNDTTQWTDDANITCKNIAGYLTFERVGDFVKKHGITTLSPVYSYANRARSLATNDYIHVCAECASNGDLVGATYIYDDYIIPYIRWFVDDENGNRTELDVENHIVTVNSVYSFTAFEISSFFNLGGASGYIGIPQQVGAGNAMIFSLPYVDIRDFERSDVWRGGNVNALYCGSVVANHNPNFGGFYREIIPSGAPFCTLSPGKYGSSVGGEIFEIRGGKYVFGAEGLAEFDMITVYKSVDDFIKLFDDAGIFISTDLADVYQHTDIVPTVNPEPTDSLDSYPDNTTDITPINSSYITPSSFGGQLIYNPLTAKSFFKWVGDSGVNISNWGRLFANPIDVVLGAKLYNLDLVQHDSAHVRANAKTDVLGVVNPDLPNYSIDIGYNNIVDGGTLNLIAYYGNYADFTSMTYQCYIPYVGFITLRAGDVVNTVLHLQYAVDFSTGSAVALLTSNQKLIFSAACNVAGNIPIAVSDRFSQELNNSITALRGVGNVILGAAQKNPFAVAGALKDTVSGLQLQTHYSQRGNLNSINAFELIPPFIERTRFDLFYPNNDADNYKKYVGTPSTQFDILAHCADSNGYVTANYVYLSDCPATAAEQAEIKRIISGGVYL